MGDFDWIEQTIQALSFRRLKTKPWRPPQPVDFDRLESKLAAPLPGDYRYFISRWGGGRLGDDDAYVESDLLEACPWGSSVEPETFYPLLEEHSYSLEKMLEIFRSRLPVGVLPFSTDAGGNQLCLDVAGRFPNSVWFWDHEQRWFPHDLETAAQELRLVGTDTSGLSAHDIIRAWARIHPEACDRPADYMGMYRMAPSFADYLRSLHRASSSENDE